MRMSDRDRETSIAEASTFGRQLVAQRRRVIGACEVCGARVEGYVGKRFCSTRCQVADYRRRRREERRRAGA